MNGLEDAALAGVICADEQSYIAERNLDLLDALKPMNCDWLKSSHGVPRRLMLGNGTSCGTEIGTERAASKHY
jgi:hypothetical protein